VYGYGQMVQMFPRAFGASATLPPASESGYHRQVEVGRLLSWGGMISKPLVVSSEDSAELLIRDACNIKSNTCEKPVHESVVLTPGMFPSTPRNALMNGPRSIKSFGSQRVPAEEDAYLFLCTDFLCIARPAQSEARFLKAEALSFENLWIVKDEHFVNDLLLVWPGGRARLTLGAESVRRFKDNLPPLNVSSMEQWEAQLTQAISESMRDPIKLKKRLECNLSLDELGFVTCTPREATHVAPAPALMKRLGISKREKK
jgi:hypothetical protein